MIQSISYSQDEILQNIITLHCPGGFELDPTYGSGNFYKKIPRPKFCFDLYPKFDFVQQADCRDIPVEKCSISSIIFDPPFIHAPGRNSIMGKQFGGYKSQAEIYELYWRSMRCFDKILGPKGILVFKCQDIIESGKQVMNHCLVYNMALAMDWKVLDLFILLSKNRIKGFNHKRQLHARKFHSYFWVFRCS